MRSLLVLALVLLTAACGAYRFPPGSGPGTGTVTGQVVAVPCSPVEYPQTQCKGLPVPRLVIVFTRGDGSAVSATTDSNGNYAVDLDAGTWAVSIKNVRVINGASTVTVRAGVTLVENYLVDSGIRVPQPAA